MAALPASADTDSPDRQVLSYLNGGNYSPDGISNLRSVVVDAPTLAFFTPDGVNQVEFAVGPSRQVLSYLNGGNYSPDGVSNLQSGIALRSGFTDVAFLYAESTDPSSVG